MANIHREMMSRNQSNQFVKSNQFHRHGGQLETRPFLNQQNMPVSQRNPIPIPRYNPAVPPPGFNVTSFLPHAAQSLSMSHNFLGPQGMHPPPFSARGSVGPNTGYQKVPNSPLVAPFQPRNNAPYLFIPPAISSAPIGSPLTTSQPSQEELDKLWVKQWLEQHQIKPSVNVSKKTIKVSL